MPKTDGGRVVADLRRLAEFGRYKTGVHRPTYSAEDVASRQWLADKLELQVAAAAAAGTPDVAVFHVKVVYGRDEARVYGPGRICCVPRLPDTEQDRDFVKITHRENLMSPQTLMFSRSVLEKVGLFDRLLVNSVDWDFSLRLVRHAKVIFIEDPALQRVAIAKTPGTTVLTVGAESGKIFTPSSWESALLD